MVWLIINYVLSSLFDVLNHFKMKFVDRYYSLVEHINAIECILLTDEHSARYLGDRRFEVDCKPYLFLERTVPVGGVPT